MRRLIVCFAALLCCLAQIPSAGAAGDFTPYQWGLNQIHAREAWQVSTGAGVTVGVVDTGADAGHPDFGGRVSTVDCTNTGGSSANCRGGGSDIHGHGTHVAGIIAAANDGSGTAGTAPGANVIVARVFTCDPSCEDPGASSEDVEAGINHLLDRGVVAINLSLGDGGFAGSGLLCSNTRFAQILNNIWNRGAVPVFAAGNCGGGFLGGGADYSGVNALVVGATGPSGNRTSYTNDMSTARWGLLAPGGDGTCDPQGQNCILSTWPRDKSGGGDPYYLLQGTSMAAPHVAGAVAALRARGHSQQGAVDAIVNNLDSVSCGSGCRGLLNMQRALGAPNVSGGGATTTVPPGGGFGGTGGNVNRTPTTRRAPATTRPTTPPVTVGTTAAPTTTVTEPPPTTTTEPPAAVRNQALRINEDPDDGGISWAWGVIAIVGLLAAGAATALLGRGYYSARGGEGL